MMFHKKNYFQQMNDSRFSPLLDEQVAAGLRGDFKRGMEIAEELKKTYPHCNRAKFNRAWYEMMKGDLLTGLELLDAGRWESAFGDKPLPTNKPIWRDEKLKDKHLLLRAEGGLGDEIINVRFAKDFAERGAHVTVTCDPSLASVFARIKGVSAVVNHIAAPQIYHDFWVPAMSAARVLGKTYKSLSGKPYLTADPAHIEKWTQILNEKFSKSNIRIGLKFYGNPKFEHEQHRRFNTDDLKNTLDGFQWVNMQLEETDLPLKSWEDTLGLIENLDLVITSCTSVAHASAALGKPTWVIVPILPYYIWALPGPKSPWYDSVTLFRQEKFGQWDNVFRDIRAALQK
jgi:hypothetical protein